MTRARRCARACTSPATRGPPDECQPRGAPAEACPSPGPGASPGLGAPPELGASPGSPLPGASSGAADTDVCAMDGCSASRAAARSAGSSAGDNWAGIARSAAGAALAGAMGVGVATVRVTGVGVVAARVTGVGVGVARATGEGVVNERALSVGPGVPPGGWAKRDAGARLSTSGGSRISMRGVGS